MKNLNMFGKYSVGRTKYGEIMTGIYITILLLGIGCIIANKLGTFLGYVIATIQNQ